MEFAPVLDAFAALCARRPGPIPWSATWEGGGPGHVVFGCLVHGDETGSLPAALALFERLESKNVRFSGRVTLFLGNPDAARAGARFVDFDLNRAFGAGAPADARETRRARELMPLLAGADVFFDFHQTIESTLRPFYTFAFHRPAALWARLAGVADVLVTRRPGASFAGAGLLGTDEYASLQGVPAVTIELGRRGLDPDSAARALSIMTRVCEAAERLGPRVVPLARAGDAPRPRLRASSRALERLARRRRPLRLLETLHREPFADPRAALHPGLINFRPVRAGEELGRSPSDESGEADASRALRSPVDGFILFPKYPPRESDGRAREPRPTQIYQLVGQPGPRSLRRWR